MSQYKFLIVDGNNFLYRAFFSKKAEIIVDGVNLSTIYNFLKMLKYITRRFRPDKVYFTWDKKLNPTTHNFRKDLVDYKDNRKDSDSVRELHSNIEIIQQYLDAIGVTTIYPVNLEGDDVINYLCSKLDGKKIIVSSDKDLLQLVSEDTHVLLPTKDTIITLENFEENVKIKKDLFVLYKCIYGDSSDNIPGVSGYGPVKSKALAENFDPENVSDEIKQIVERNNKIMNLDYARQAYTEEFEQYDKQFNECNKEYDSEKLLELFNKHNFYALTRKIGEWAEIFNKNGKFDLLSSIFM